MNCPNCHLKMEYEEHVGKNPITDQADMPEANYWCEECGLEADWFGLRNRFVVTWDPRVEGTDKVTLEIW